jgi:hypothetical protein
MQLRPELVRDILLTVEEYLPFRQSEFVWPADVADVSEEELDYHFIILIDAGLLEGSHSRSAGGTYHVIVERLTPYGHEYVDALRNEPVFREVQKQLNVRKLVSVPIDVLIQLAKKAMLDMAVGN